MGAGSDFLRDVRADRHGKSPEGFDGTTNRYGVLRGVNSQSPAEVLGTVALKGEPFTAFRRLQRPGPVLQFDNEDVTVAFDPDVDVDRFVYTW